MIRIRVLVLRSAGANETQAQRAVILGLILINAAYTVMYFLITQSGQINFLGWASVMTHLTLALLLLFRGAVGPALRC